MNRKKQRRLAVAIIAFVSFTVISIAYLTYSIHDIKSEQEERYEEINRKLSDLQNQYKEDLDKVRTSYDKKLERMGNFVVETREKYQNKTQELLRMVEETERKNNIQLQELRRELKKNDEDMSKVVKRVIKYAVSVNSSVAQGSGAVVRPKYVVTNNHVVKGIENVTLIDHNGEARTATVALRKPGKDLALLRTEKPFSQSFEILDSSEVLKGERVIAIGSPEGFDFTVTQGIVSAVNRTFENGGYIQTDVSVESGSSGGPLINSDGKLIGINTFKIKGSDGLGFAIPGNQVKKLLSEANISG